MATAKYDVVVIGSGPAGGHIAGRCNSAGFKVAVIEKYGLGGTCPLRGCEPKKVLADMAETVERFRNSVGNGINGEARINWADLMSFKRSFTEPIPAKVHKHYTEKGIDVYEGTASFTGPNSLKVGGAEISARKICIAAGAKPQALDIDGEGLLSTSTDFLDLEELPERIVFIGGGFVAFELAHVAAVAGAQVTIVHRSERVLRNFDHDLSERLCRQMKEIGVSIYMNHPSKSLKRADDGLVLKAGDDGGVEFTADMVVHGAGRVPDIDDLNLSAAEVETGFGGISVNGYMQSVSNPDVYAAGDVVAKGMPLTPVASAEAEIAALAIIEGPEYEMDYGLTPYALFTYPPIAAVGVLEEQAEEKGMDFDVIQGDAAKWAEYQRIGQTCAEFKLIVDRGTRQVLGAHMMGDRAEEMINLITLGMRNGLTIDELANMKWAYPSFGYAVQYMLR